jgi:hypothetical protein
MVFRVCRSWREWHEVVNGADEGVKAAVAAYGVASDAAGSQESWVYRLVENGASREQLRLARQDLRAAVKAWKAAEEALDVAVAAAAKLQVEASQD